MKTAVAAWGGLCVILAACARPTPSPGASAQGLKAHPPSEAKAEKAFAPTVPSEPRSGAVVLAGPSGEFVPEQMVFQAPPGGCGKGGNGIDERRFEYRIPALVRADNGALVAFAEKRYCSKRHRDSGYIKTVYRVLENPADASQAWSPERVLCDFPPTPENPDGYTCGNPTAVFDSEARQLVVLLSVNDARVTHRQLDGMLLSAPDARPTYVATSVQVGDAIGADLQFTSPKRLEGIAPPGMNWDAAGPGNGIQLDDGRLVFPARGRLIVRDHNQWDYRQRKGPDEFSFMEGTVVQRNDGSLLRGYRPSAKPWKRVFRRAVSVSLNDTFTEWSEWTQENQPLSPGHYCKSSVCSSTVDRCEVAFAKPSPKGCRNRPKHVHASMGRLSIEPISRLFLVNPGNSQHRTGMFVHLSYDEGATWPMRRAIVPLRKRTGYNSTASVPGADGPGLGVLYEVRSRAIQSVVYSWRSLRWLLCGRKEPVVIAGNAWMGNFDDVQIGKQGSKTYVARVDGQLVRVSTPLAKLSDKVQQVNFDLGGTERVATVSPDRPGEYRFADGRIVRLGLVPTQIADCRQAH